MLKILVMKTQHQHKTLVPKQTLFGAEKEAKQKQSNSDVMAFDEEAAFDTHWSYSYIMDYIWSHKKIKKRKS
jgi:hypothetical protein